MSANQKLPPRPRRIPPHVLLRRRIIAVLIVLAVLGLIIWGIWALVGWLTSDDDTVPESAPTVTETVAPTEEASAEPSEEPSDEQDAAVSDVAACKPEFLVVSGSTDKASYGPNDAVAFTLTVAHEGDVLCDASLGSDQQVFAVEDAAGEFVFSTRACQVNPQEQVVEMEPGQAESVLFQWDRVGTDEQCETSTPTEPGTYFLRVGLGDSLSEPVQFELE